jgi:hypothetical protein
MAGTAYTLQSVTPGTHTARVRLADGTEGKVVAVTRPSGEAGRVCVDTGRYETWRPLGEIATVIGYDRRNG